MYSPTPQWSFDQPFFTSLTHWLARQQLSLHSIVFDPDQATPLDIPPSLRPLFASLGHLTQLGIATPTLNHDINTLLISVIAWITHIQSSSNSGKLAKSAWPSLQNMHDLLNEISLCAESVHLHEEDKAEIEDFRERIVQVIKLFKDFQFFPQTSTKSLKLSRLKIPSSPRKPQHQNDPVMEEIFRLRAMRSHSTLSPASFTTSLSITREKSPISPSMSLESMSSTTRSITPPRPKLFRAQTIPTLVVPGRKEKSSSKEKLASPVLDDVTTHIHSTLVTLVKSHNEAAKKWKKKQWTAVKDKAISLGSQAASRWTWASTALAFLSAQVAHKGIDNLDDNIDALLVDGLDDLESLYSLVLNKTHIGKHRLEQEQELFRRLTGMMSCLQDQLSVHDLTELLDLSMKVPRGGQQTPVDVRAFLERWDGLLLDPTKRDRGRVNRTTTIPDIHPDFITYITSDRADEKWRVNTAEAELELGLRCLLRLGKVSDSSSPSKAISYALKHYSEHLKRSDRDVRGIVVVKHQATTFPPSELASVLRYQAEKRATNRVTMSTSSDDCEETAFDVEKEMEMGFTGVDAESRAGWTVLKIRKNGYLDGVKWYVPVPPTPAGEVTWAFVERGIVRVQGNTVTVLCAQ